VKHKHVKSVTAITEVFPDGQKVTAVAVEYDKNIDNAKLLASTFSVNGRTITKVYANDAAAKAIQGVDGRYVIIEFSIYDKEASTIVENREDKQTKSCRNEIKVCILQLGDITTTDGEKYSQDPDIIINSSTKLDVLHF
jgi:predicted peptidase